ncbi:MAG TPA: IS66 family transposase zinc-finger binding domain-containing protein [Thermomicrobiales bacterium]|nr:IS66 family transposase zinc-finger binding domain-containing protein [Thermomicrobiales bacterium]
MLERAALEQLDREALVELALEAQVAALAARVEELGGRPPAPPPAPAPPAFVKPAASPKPGDRPRQRRPQGFAPRGEAPTRVVEHAVAACPACGAALRWGEVVRRRQVLHVPPAPADVVEHVVPRRVCHSSRYSAR